MPLIPCPVCGHNVSSTAEKCPSCAHDIQKFLRDDLTHHAVGFPVLPLEAWEAHFWYYSGCRSTQIELPSEGWIKCHEPLMSLRYYANDGKEVKCTISSPTDGLVIRSKIVLRRMPKIGYTYDPGPSSRGFIVIRPLKKHVINKEIPFERVSWCNSFCFDPLIQEIYDAVTGKNTFSQLLSLASPSGGIRKLDPKKFFNTREDLFKAASDLNNSGIVNLV